jgi:PAS domain S-box-containing protein
MVDLLDRTHGPNRQSTKTDIEILQEIHRGLDQGEFVPHFQPLINLRTWRVAGYEVLARWRHPRHGLILPGDFLPTIESVGLMGRLTDTILSQAFTVMSHLPDEISFSINISPVQFHDPYLPDQIRRTAVPLGISLKRLTVELTENALVDNLPSALAVANDLKQLGVKLSLDDFGTGYSSLTNLHSLPFDELKVDRSFVSSMTSRRESRKIVAAVVGLGRSLGLRTVAEGVETEAQAEMLLCLGCEIAQGWLFGKAICPEEILAGAGVAHYAEGAGHHHTVHDPMICLDALPSQRLAQLQAIYNGAPVGLCMLDCDLRYVSLNHRLAEMHGVPLTEHLGRTLEEILPGTFREIQPYLLRALAGEAIEGVEIQASGDYGSRTSLLHSYEPARDEAGEVVGISIAVIDISAKKDAEERSRTVEARLQSIIDAVPVGIVIAEAPTGRIVGCNPQAERILNQPVQFQGIADYSERIAYRRNGQLLKAEDYPLARAILHGETTAPQVLYYDLGNRNGKWLSVSGAPIRNDHGDITGAVAVIQETRLT